jgi:hypothetical protein
VATVKDRVVAEGFVEAARRKAGEVYYEFPFFAA